MKNLGLEPRKEDKEENNDAVDIGAGFAASEFPRRPQAKNLPSHLNMIGPYWMTELQKGQLKPLPLAQGFK